MSNRISLALFLLLISMYSWAQIGENYNPKTSSDPENPTQEYTLKLKASPTNGGSFNATSINLSGGKTCNLRAYPNTDFSFVAWLCNGDTLSKSTSYTYTMPYSDVEIIGVFSYNPLNPSDPNMVVKKYTLHIKATPSEGGIFNSSDAKVSVGEQYNIRAYPNTDFAFVAWLCEGDTLSKLASYSYTMPPHNVNITGVFSYSPSNPSDPSKQPLKYQLSMIADPMNSGSFNISNERLSVGSSNNLQAYANTDFAFKCWMIGDSVLSTNANINFVMPSHNVQMVGVFEYNPANPTNPNSNYWDAATGEVIVDDFKAGSLSTEIKNAIGNNTSYSNVLSVTVAGVMNNSDFNVTNNCSRCTSLDLSRTSGFSAIPSYAFDYTPLQTVSLPSSVERIGSRAFYQCSQLNSMTIYALTPPVLEYYALQGVNKDMIVFVPASVVAQYQEADGWKDFTILPIQDELRSLRVSLPKTAKPSDYKNMYLELTNTKSGQRQHFVMTDREEYAFSNIIKNTEWNVTLKSERGDIYGEIRNVAVKDSDVAVVFTSLKKPQDVTVKVLTPEGKDVTDQTSITWLDHNGNYIAQAASLNSLPVGMQLSCQISLQQQALAMKYAVPTSISYVVKEGTNHITSTLSALPQLTITGRVIESKTHTPMSQAIVTASQTFNGKFNNTLTTQTDEQGHYELTIPQASTNLTISSSDYISQSISCDTLKAQGDTLNVATVTLKPIDGATINVNVNYQPSAETTTESTQEWYTNYNNIAFTVYNKTKHTAVDNISVQYPRIILLEDVNVGDELTITATSKTGDFMPIQVSAIIDEQFKATAQLRIVEKGGIRASFTKNNNEQVVGTLYDKEGYLVQSNDYQNGLLSINQLNDGHYTLVTMGKSSLFNTVYNLAQLKETGLHADTDYVTNDVEVESGKLASIRIEEVPTLNESNLYYTSGNTSFTANKSELVIGSYLTLSARLDFKAEYAKKVSNINLIVDLPEGCDFVENSVIVGRTTNSYLHSGSRLTIPISSVSDLVRFCVVPTLGGNFTPSAFIQFAIDGKTIKQPIGAAYYTAKNLSINVPNVVSKESISISGTAPTQSAIEIYDNDVLIGQTQSQSNGNWYVICNLCEPYNLSIHHIQAKANTKKGQMLLSDIATCQYDVNAIQAKTVDMSFYNGYLHRNVQVHFDLENQTSDVDSYSFYTSTDFTFAADLSNNNPEKVKSVTICVYTSDKKWKKLLASYDKRLDKWVAVQRFGSKSLPIGVKVDFIADVTPQFDADNIKDILTSLPQKLEEFKGYQNTIDQSSKVLESIFDDDVISSPVEFATKLNAYLISIGEEPIGSIENDKVITEEELNELTNSINQLLKGDIIAQLDSIISLDINSLDKLKPYLNGIELSQITGITEDGLLAQGYKAFSKTDGTNIYLLLGENDYDIVDPTIGIRLRFNNETIEQSNKFSSQSNGDFVERMNAACKKIKGYCEVFKSSVQAVVDAISSLEETLIASNNKLSAHLEDLYTTSRYLIDKGHADLFRKYQIKAQIYAANEAKRANEKIIKWIGNNLRPFKIGAKATRAFGVTSLALDLYDGITNINKIVSLHKKCLPCKDDETNARAIQNSLEVLGVETVAFYVAQATSDIAAIVSAQSGIFAAIPTGGTSLAAVGISIGLVAANFAACQVFSKVFDKNIVNINVRIRSLKCKKEDKKDDDNNNDNMPPRPIINPIHDPSGYVYESVLSNRLEGVKATAYYKETVEDMYGDLHENVVKWNAEEYAQKNPLFTDANGYYQWDVPQGLWQVKFEKEGYETAYSEWLPVPPPQLDVNIGMKQNVQPQVKEAKAYDDAVEVVFDKYMDISTLTTDNVQVLSDGKAVEGTIELKNAEEDYADNSRTYASKLRFNATQSFPSTEVTLVVKNQVKSYADIRMATDFMQDFTVSHEAKRIVCDSLIEVVYGQTGEVQLEVLPAAAAAGKEVEVSLSSDLILSTAQTSCTLDENGRATLNINGELPGMAAATFHVVGTELTATTLISVVQPTVTVEAPTSSLASGSTIDWGTAITLDSKTEGAQIYYTLDGSCPCEDTDARRLYDGNPIILSSDTELKAMAILDGTESEVVTFVYKIDYLNEAKKIVAYEKTIPANAIGSFCQVEEVKAAIAANDVTLCKSLVEAYHARTAPVIEAGYYRLMNAQDKKYLTPYLSGTDILMHAGTEEKGISNVFEFVPTTTDGQFVIKANGCRVSKCYTAALGSSGANFMIIDENSAEEGHFSFENAKSNALFLIAENATTTSGHRNYLHEDNGNAIGWEKGDNNGVGHPSAWYIVPATEAEVALTTVNDASYASAYLPFNASHVEGAKAYYGTLNEEHTIMDMYATAGIAAGKGVVLIGPADAEKATLTIGETDTFESSLSGTLNELTLTSDTRADYLIFGVNEGNVGFYKPNAEISAITANKAFLYNTFGSSAIAMRFNGSVVGISDVITINVTDAPIFDLSGRRVVNPVKGGVYIQNGHKFIK